METVWTAVKRATDPLRYSSLYCVSLRPGLFRPEDGQAFARLPDFRGECGIGLLAEL